MNEAEENALEELRIAVQNLNIDCGDNSCMYAKKKGGMRTNGGCRCFQDFRGMARINIERVIRFAMKLEKAGSDTSIKTPPPLPPDPMNECECGRPVDGHKHWRQP